MESTAIALFGEAEKGVFGKGYFCHDLLELMYYLGNPPSDSQGLFYAVQTLLYHYHLIYFRVEEEGFSTQDYLTGLKILYETPEMITISAICAPGVGDHQIMNALIPLCLEHRKIFITNERDFFDYLSA